MNSDLKTRMVWGLTLAASLSLWAQPARPETLDAKAASPGEATIVERGSNHRVWRRVEDIQIGKRTRQQVHQYTEMATGMHYTKPDAPGQWFESKEVIEIVNGFGVATQGEIQVIFSPNLNTSGAIDAVTPHGRFQSTVLGLAFTDISG